MWADVGRKRTMTMHPAFAGLTSSIADQLYMRNLGWHTECALTRTGDAQGIPVRSYLGEVYPFNGPDTLGRYEWLISLTAPPGSSVSATCYTDN